jgi:GT2 family glycosyltransferase
MIECSATDIQIAIVLYKNDLENCSSYQTLKQHKNSLTIKNSLLIYNNDDSIKIQDIEGAEVVNAKQNNMLVGAYNYALHRAKSNKSKWLLLLDSDSVLTKEYLQDINTFVSNSGNLKYGAVVPILHKNNVQLSPIIYNEKFGPFLFYKMHKTNYVLKKHECISAFNSGCVLNVYAVESIGGFNISFPLDMLDHSYFWEMHKNNHPIFVFETKIEHNLSIANRDDMQMSIVRYENYLGAQKKLAKIMGKTAQLFLWTRWLIVFLLQLSKPQMHPLSKITFKYLIVKK